MEDAAIKLQRALRTARAAQKLRQQTLLAQSQRKVSRRLLSFGRSKVRPHVAAAPWIRRR